MSETVTVSAGGRSLLGVIDTVVIGASVGFGLECGSFKFKCLSKELVCVGIVVGLGLKTGRAVVGGD